MNKQVAISTLLYPFLIYSHISTSFGVHFFKLYRFSDGKGFEPDYIMFLDKGDESEITALQLFIEPKGEPYLVMDELKEKFLLSIKDNIKFEHKSLDLKIIGLPFYNETITKLKFEKAFFDALKL